MTNGSDINWKLVAGYLSARVTQAHLAAASILGLADESPTVGLAHAKDQAKKLLRLEEAPKQDCLGTCKTCGHPTDAAETEGALRAALAREAQLQRSIRAERDTALLFLRDVLQFCNDRPFILDEKCAARYCELRDGIEEFTAPFPFESILAELAQGLPVNDN